MFRHSSASGIVAVPDPKNASHYNLFMYLDPSACNFLTHGSAHYWEQSVSKMAPGSYTALLYNFRVLRAFRSKYEGINPSWFRKGATPMTEAEVVGTYEQPGILFNMTMIKEADKRFEAEIKALADNGLPYMPGFKSLCPVPVPCNTGRCKKDRRRTVL